jgi:hypothetical protein
MLAVYKEIPITAEEVLDELAKKPRKLKNCNLKICYNLCVMCIIYNKYVICIIPKFYIIKWIN